MNPDQEKLDGEIYVCLLHPTLSSVHAEMMMIEEMDGTEQWAKVGGELLKNVTFADDQEMKARREAGLQRLKDNLNYETIKSGMKINAGKTKTM